MKIKTNLNRLSQTKWQSGTGRDVKNVVPTHYKEAEEHVGAGLGHVAVVHVQGQVHHQGHTVVPTTTTYVQLPH